MLLTKTVRQFYHRFYQSQRSTGQDLDSDAEVVRGDVQYGALGVRPLVLGVGQVGWAVQSHTVAGVKNNAPN